VSDRILVASDVDGTLLDGDKRVSAFTAETFRALARRGGFEFALASSRMPASLRAVEAALGVPCHVVAYDGAMVQRAGDARCLNDPDACVMDPGVVAGMLGESPVIDYVGFFYRDTWITNGEARWTAHEEHGTMVTARVDRAILADYGTVFGSGLHKLMFRGEKPLISALRDGIRRDESDSVHVYGNSDTIVEILPRATTKADGIRRLAAAAGIGDDNVWVFGDGYNDVNVFQAFGNSVAVGNAKDALKALARHRTEPGVEDGVARFLRRQFLE
jgi:Cof subfamily protein (haloacid dehalogenase superfamily)